MGHLHSYIPQWLPSAYRIKSKLLDRALRPLMGLFLPVEYPPLALLGAIQLLVCRSNQIPVPVGFVGLLFKELSALPAKIGQFSPGNFQ